MVPDAFRRGRARVSSLVFGVALFSSSPELLAVDAASAQARQHFERGYTLAADGDFAAAIEEFERAQALRPNVSLLYNLGQAYAAAGRSSDAVTTLERYLGHAGSEITPERQRQVEAILRYHSARVGRMELDVSPPGASVVVDGKPLGVAPFAQPLVLAAGIHAVVVTAPGFAPAAASVEVQAKQASRLKLALEPLAGSTALLLVDCDLAQVELHVDGAAVAMSRGALAVPVAPGTHSVRFSRAGYVPDERRVAARAGVTPRITCALRPDPTHAGLARLRIHHRAGVSVLVDGTPFDGQPLPSGAHQVRTTGQSGGAELRLVHLTPGRTTELTLPSLPRADARSNREAERRHALRIASYVTGGLSAVALTLATVLYVDNSARWSSWDERNEALRSRPRASGPELLREVDALLEQENALRNRDAAAVGFGAAGGALLAGAAAMFIASRPPAEHWVTTGHGQIGLGYRGEF